MRQKVNHSMVGTSASIKLIVEANISSFLKQKVKNKACTKKRARLGLFLEKILFTTHFEWNKDSQEHL